MFLYQQIDIVLGKDKNAKRCEAVKQRKAWCGQSMGSQKFGLDLVIEQQQWVLSDPSLSVT